MKIVFLLISFLFIALASAAQNEPIATDRPDQTETPQLVPPKYLQLEHGLTLEKDGPVKMLFIPSTLIRYGVNEYFELRLVAEPLVYWNGGSDFGFSPLEAGVKIKMLEEKGCLPQLAFIGHVAIPKTATDVFDIVYVAPSFRIAANHGITDNFGIGYNAGIEWDGLSAEPTFIYTLTLAAGLTDKLSAFAEVYGFIPQKSDFIDHRIDGGFTYLINNDFQLDLSAGWGYTADAPDYFAGIGVSYRFGL